MITQAAPPTQTGQPPLGTRYQAGGRRLLLHRSGQGGPAVVFLPGAGHVGLDYLNVHQQVAEITTSVLYDRAGTGWSDDVDLPRTAKTVAAELRQLLQAAEVPPPYLLVGHSLGGAYARRYAQLYPDEVAGLLFLEPFYEGFSTVKMTRTIRDTLWQIFALARLSLHVKPFYRRMFTQQFASWPDAVRGPLVEYHLKTLRNTIKERKNLFTEIEPETKQGGALPDVPLIVLAATGIDPYQAVVLPATQLRELNSSKAALYAPLVQSVPRGEYREVPGAGHDTLWTERPDAVLQALRDLVKA
jgi:pimeloyl-ACP methyl ester carboxylesterase